MKPAWKQILGWLTLLILALAYLLPEGSLPWRCVFKNVSGRPCPFCHGTSALHNFAHGRFGQAFLDNPLVSLLVLLGLLLFIETTMGRLARKSPDRMPRLPQKVWIVLGLILLLANWLYLLLIAAG